MFLDALITIKDEIDGRHHLACLCGVLKDNDEKSVISPLMFMFVLKDLVVDMSHFYAQNNRSSLSCR